MNKLVKGIFRFLIQIAVIVILIVVVNVFINGMYLLGLPNLSDIQSASISYPSVTEDIKEVSSPEDIELALKLTGFLKYNLLEKSDTVEKPLITMTYHLKDGTDKTISANNTTVWWNDKSYTIKKKKCLSI